MQAPDRVERITAALALAAIARRPRKLDGPDEGLDGATYRRAGLPQPRTCPPGPSGAPVFGVMAVLHTRLGYAGGERLAQPPERLTHVVSGQRGLGQLAC